MRSAVVLALSLAIAGVAHAGPAEDAAAAKGHYDRGTRLYDLAKYDEAIKEFESAFEIKDSPVLLYNIAQSYRLWGKYPEALRFYRKFLQKMPKAPNKAEVEAKIKDMEDLIAKQNKVASAPAAGTLPPPAPTPPAPRPVVAPAPAPVVAAPPPPPPVVVAPRPEPVEPKPEPVEPKVAAVEPPRPGEPVERPAELKPEPTPAFVEPARPSAAPNPGRTKLIAGIVVAAVGVATLGAGVAFGVMAMGNSSDQEKSVKFDPALDSTGRTNQTIGLALDIGGGALIAAGLGVAVWGALSKSSGERSSARVERRFTVLPAAGPGFAGGNVRFEF